MQEMVDGKLMVLVHDDAKSAEDRTILEEDGWCPKCCFYPEMRSTSFVSFDGLRKEKDKTSP